MTTEAAPPARPRRVILSQRRAMEIVERVAAKHELSVAVALCSRRDRYAVACRAEIAWTIREQLNWSLRRIGQLLGVSHEAVRQLLDCHKIALRRARRSLPPTDLAALAAMDRDALRRRVAELEEMNAYLQSELDRLTGAGLVPTLAQEFGLENAQRCAIVLAILAEAYPRAVSMNHMIELYEDACDQLNYGARQGATSNLVAKNISDLRERFAQQGLPDPVSLSEGNNRSLSHEAAQVLYERTGTPSLTRLRLAHNIPHPFARHEQRCSYDQQSYRRQQAC